MIDPIVFKSTLVALETLRQGFVKSNPSDFDLALFKDLLLRLGEQYDACMEDLGKPTKSQSYLEGYVAGWNDHREGKTMQVFVQGQLGAEEVDLVDPDTGDVLRGVPTMGNDPTHQQLGAHLRQASHTAQMELIDRVAKLETDVMRMRRDMGERIREIATGGK